MSWQGPSCLRPPYELLIAPMEVHLSEAAPAWELMLVLEVKKTN